MFFFIFVININFAAQVAALLKLTVIAAALTAVLISSKLAMQVTATGAELFFKDSAKNKFLRIN